MTGGIIEFWSLADNPDAGRSRKYAHVVIDEAAKIPNLEKAWSYGIYPTLADLRGGADFLSTPRGHDFFWRAWTWGQSHDHADWRSWQLPTSTNPYIHPDEITSLRGQLPERAFRQELMGEFLEDAGGVFTGVSSVIDRGRIASESARPGLANYSTGIDLARTEDFTVLCTLDWQGKQVYFERFNQISWQRQIDRIAEVLRLYPGTGIVDSTGVGDPIFEALRARRLNVRPFQFTNASKTELIDGLALAIERRQIHLMDIPEQENELVAFEYQMSPGSRTIRMAAPEGMNDDCVIALALARHAQGQPRLPMFVRM